MRDKSAKDFTQIRQIKDEQGVGQWEHHKIIERWKGYYGKLLNEENPRTAFGDGVPNEGLKCYYRPTASLQLNNKRNTKYNITIT